MEAKFLEYNPLEVKKIIDSLFKQDLERIFDFILNNGNIKNKFGTTIDSAILDKKKRASTKIAVFKDELEKLLMKIQIRVSLYEIFNNDKTTFFIYYMLVWENPILHIEELPEGLNIKPLARANNYENVVEKNLEGDKSLIIQRANFDYRGKTSEYLYIEPKIKNLLRFFVKMPEDYDLNIVKNLEPCEYSYNNKDGIFSFLHTFLDMKKNNLIEFGKNSEKPLAKTLQILKSTTAMQDFFTQKGDDTYALDMLTRSFWFQSGASGVDNLAILKEFVGNKFEGKYDFFISRIFTAHLKRVRFDPYYSSEVGLFATLSTIIKDMPKDDWVEMKNIILYCKYRGLFFHFEDSHKTSYYEFEGELKYENGMSDSGMFYVKEGGYLALFFVPILKGALFYLASLGVLEIKYDTPKSDNPFTLKDKPYITPWDALKYIKLTELGKYIFGYSKSYTQKEIKVEKKDIKFDEFKPIIIVNPKDSITIAKLDGYCEKLEEGRYILSYTKIFRDCNSYKALELKIDGFYKLFPTMPPKVFEEFLESIKRRANLLKRDLKLITIELKENRELLELMATNKKIQELIIKAQGYRILVQKEEIPKLRKLLADNGFFIDF